MIVDAPALALPAQELEELGERRVVGDDADRHAVVGDGRGHGLVVADVADGEDQAAARAPRARGARTSSTSRSGTSADDLVGGRDGRRISSTR